MEVASVGFVEVTGHLYLLSEEDAEVSMRRRCQAVVEE
jgi:hypothetical protein